MDVLAINRIILHYSDELLMKEIQSYRNSGPVTPATAYDPRYALALTLDDLKGQNQFCAMNQDGGTKLTQKKYISFAGSDEILFARGKFPITTSANACMSYMLYCREKHLGAAVHVNSSHIGNVSFHLRMLKTGFNTLRKMAPEDEMVAFISGGYALHMNNEPYRCHEYVANYNRELLRLVIGNLLENGIRIEEINIGDDFREQKLDLATGEFTARTEISK